MNPAARFVQPQWRAAFDAIGDESQSLVAGTAAWVRVTHVVHKKRHLGKGLKAEVIVEEPAELAYYLVTDGGLHVGQDKPRRATVAEPGFTQAEGTPQLDYFVPRDRVTSVARWVESGGGAMAKVNLGTDGACVDIRFLDVSRQLSGGSEDELSDELQRENLIRAVIDGVAPIIASATKTCPDCAESVKYKANVCRFCGYRFDGAPQPRGSMLRALASRLAERISDQPRVPDQHSVEPHPIGEEYAARGDLDEDLREQAAGSNGNGL